MSKTSESKSVSKVKHLPTILLGLIVAVIFLLAIFTYQVTAAEQALVLTLGKITDQKGPGLHFRLPYPIQEIVKYDIRLTTFDGNIGKLEETTTADQKNVIVGIYVIYKLEDLKVFKNAAKSIADAEGYLGDRMRTVKGGVVGKFKFDEMINTDPGKMKLDDMKAEMLAGLKDDMMKHYGIDVVSVGIRSIGVPEASAKAIAATMKQERDTAAKKFRAEGNTVAQKIRTDADRAKQEILADAQAQAKKLMAEGDAEAAKYYSVFNQDPELASFLRKLDSLKRIVSTKTTLVLDTDSTPFDIFKMKIQYDDDAGRAGGVPGGKK